MHGDEEVVARQTVAAFAGLGADHDGVGVLDKECLHRRTLAEVACIAGQDRSEAGLVEAARRPVAGGVQPLDQRLVEIVDGAVAPERAAALDCPGAGHRRQARGGVQIGRTVARARETVADAHIALLGRAVESREVLDLGDGEAGDLGGPGWVAGDEVGFDLLVPVAEAGQVVAVGQPLAQEDVNHGAGQRRVRAGLERQMQVGLLCRAGAVGVDHHQLGAIGLLGAGDMGHDVDLGADRIAAPDHHQLRLGDLARVHAFLGPDAGQPAGVRQGDADRRPLTGVALGVAQPLDAVALHVPHGTGIEVGPDRFGSVPLLGARQTFGHQVQRGVPGDLLEGTVADTLLSHAAQRPGEALGMVHPLRVARDLGADHTGRVGVVPAAAYLADAAFVQHLDLQSAGRGAIVRADAGRPAIREFGIQRHGRRIGRVAILPQSAKRQINRR